MKAGKSSDRTMTILKILHKYLNGEYAAWEEKDADYNTKRHLLDVIFDASCVLAQILDDDLRENRMEPEPPKVDDTRIFGYTVKEFNDLPNEVKRDLLLPLKFTVFESISTGSSSLWDGTHAEPEPIPLPITWKEYRSMPTEEAEKIIRDATCHLAHPVLRYRFKDEAFSRRVLTDEEIKNGIDEIMGRSMEEKS